MTSVAVLAFSAVAARSAIARADDRSGGAYGTAVGEVSVVGVVAIHEYTSSSPGKGVGLLVNFLPAVTGTGVGLLAYHEGWEPRYPLALHGAVVGGLPLLALGGAIDGRHDRDGFRIGPAAIAMGIAGAFAGGFLGATRIDTYHESLPFLMAPFAGAVGGFVTYAIVSFFDDRGSGDDGRLAKYTSIGALLGTVGSLIYAFPERSPDGSSPRIAPTITTGERVMVFSFGGSF